MINISLGNLKNIAYKSVCNVLSYFPNKTLNAVVSCPYESGSQPIKKEIRFQSNAKAVTCDKPYEQQMKFDGKTPANGTNKINQALSVIAPFTNDKNYRNTDNYKNAINQFAVENNPRYKQVIDAKGNVIKTYCNIFVWDVTKAMNAEIPHWVDKNNMPTTDNNGSEMNANRTFDWLQNHGSKHGWNKVTKEEAQALANKGKPVVSTWKNPNPKASGHIAMVVPNDVPDQKDIMIAQAGATNYNSTTLSKGFGNNKVNQVEFFAHD